ncbi:hypothetical protein [Azospirillum sp. SYSU D00513]|uniref:hypothetical protein n=1 Tax=Azospirillum sp. SYSU D00513 TaxID=2812561 RepID=UPI001A9628AC|nr:hypothetical protein [Azospirillum sp. SYSU D00513]
MPNRDLLTTGANPDARHDYLVELSGEAMPGTALTVRYVPDRLVARADGFAAYLAALAGFDGGPEALALAVLDDLNNELVPRWAEVAVARTAPLPHRVTVEDRQPNWDNPHLFARMRAL